MAFGTQFGESFVGSGPEAAHLNTVLGGRGGPVETSWVTALATPRSGHVAFVTVVRPGVPVRPMTLFVNKAAIAGEVHANLTWGAAHAGVASGVLWAVADGVIDEADVEDRMLIAAVWVDPAGADAGLVYANNREATRRALEAGAAGTPNVGHALAVRDAPGNAYFNAPG